MLNAVQLRFAGAFAIQGLSNVGDEKNSVKLRDEERARLIWLLTTHKTLTATLLGEITLVEPLEGETLDQDLAEVRALVSHLPPPDLADTLEALPVAERHALVAAGGG